jgi:hypothetical protein
MTILLVGVGMLASVLGLFWLKGHLASPRLGRLAYSEFMMRITVIAVVLIVVGALLTLNKLLS